MPTIRLAVLLAATAATAATAASAGAQIIRTPGGATGPGEAVTGNVLAEAHHAQAEFETYRVMHLPVARASAPSNCDERVGNWCYWYDERPGPKEPPEIAVARGKLVEQLAAFAKEIPDDRWIAAQRVRYLSESERYPEALTAAKECQTGGWWCDILLGFSYHMLGEDARSDSVYAVALDHMLPRDRCQWRDFSMLLDDDARQQYHRLACGDPRRKEFEDRVFAFARTLYGRPGNDTRTEWYARMTMTLMMQDAATPHQNGFGDDERELLMRFGWARSWARSPNRGGGFRGGFGGRQAPQGQPTFDVQSGEAVPAYRMIPAGFVLNNPSLSDSTAWRLHLPPVMGRYAPPYAKSLVILEHQKAVFKRGDSALVVFSYDAGSAKELAGAKLNAALVVTPNSAARDYIARIKDAPQRAVLTVKAPWGPLLMSGEVTAPEKNAVARARYGANPPFAVGTRVTLSDLLFFKPYGTVPETAEEAAPHAHPTERLRADEKLGVFWEAYGTDPEGEQMTISLTVVKEVEESGFFRRQAKALKLVREATPVSVSVQDMSARGSTTSARSIDLDIHTLTKGAYIVQLEVTVAGQYVVRADHRIEITTP